MLRVLHIIEDLAFGGAETQLRLLAAQSPDRHRVATLRWPGLHADRYRRAGISIAWLKARRPLGLLAARRLARQIHEFGPDAVQSWDEPSAALCRWSRPWVAVPWVHTSRVAKLGWNARNADQFLACDQIAADLSKSYGDASIVPNVANDDLQSLMDRSKARQQLRDQGADLADDAPVIAITTSFADVIGIRELLWAADLVRVVCPGLRVVVAGTGPAQLACQRFADRACERGMFIWLEGVEDLSGVYAAADVVWCGRGDSATPTPAIEAMAAGQALVMADAPGRESLLPSESNEAGCLVPWNDRAGWARVTRRLLEDRAQRSSLGDANRQRVLTDHSPGAASSAHADAFQRLMPTKT